MQLVRALVLAATTCSALAGCPSDRVCGVDEVPNVAASPGCTILPQQSESSPTTEVVPSGYEVCEGGEINRVTGACSLCHEVPLCGLPDSCAGGCGEGELCLDGFEGCACIRVCSSDDDCGAGQACACPFEESAALWSPMPFPVCVEAACRSNADCGEGGRCGVSASECGTVLGFFCRALDDQCITDEDCTPDRRLCRFSAPEDRFACGLTAEC